MKGKTLHHLLQFLFLILEASVCPLSLRKRNLLLLLNLKYRP